MCIIVNNNYIIKKKNTNTTIFITTTIIFTTTTTKRIINVIINLPVYTILVIYIPKNKCEQKVDCNLAAKMD